MNPPAVLLTDRFQEGFSLALTLHRFQTRKASPTPYISHLMGVASLILEAGGTEEEAIAGLLHDAKEDAGGPPVVKLIRDTFGDAVADMVEGCSEVYAEPKLPWLQRKQAYIARLPTESASVQLVCSADKLHNVRSLLADFKVIQHALWIRFSVGKEGTVWFYRSVADVIAKGSSKLAGALEESVSELEACAGVSGRDTVPTDGWEKPGASEHKPNHFGRALAIAYDVHANQIDKAGAPYILHPLRIMARMTTPNAMIVALLHDVVEDSEGQWTLERLRGEGFPDEVVSAIDAVSRREGEAYDAFVARAMSNPIARAVKLADLEDNMDIRRLLEIADRDVDRLRKYHRLWSQAAPSARHLAPILPGHAARNAGKPYLL